MKLKWPCELIDNPYTSWHQAHDRVNSRPSPASFLPAHTLNLELVFSFSLERDDAPLWRETPAATRTEELKLHESQRKIPWCSTYELVQCSPHPCYCLYMDESCVSLSWPFLFVTLHITRPQGARILSRENGEWKWYPEQVFCLKEPVLGTFILRSSFSSPTLACQSPWRCWKYKKTSELKARSMRVFPVSTRGAMHELRPLRSTPCYWGFIRKPDYIYDC